ncbi:MAG: zinc-ribbon domain-containing protein [Treponema sp.]|nr:zinc-ribbon domain-containing protein [Treponema sp.]
MKICSNCGRENNDTSNFCAGCGTKIITTPIFCAECGTKLKNGSKFCPQCGHKVINMENEQSYAGNISTNTRKDSEDVSSLYNFGNYDAVLPWQNYWNDELEGAIIQGYIDKAKNILEAGYAVKDIRFCVLSHIHNGRMLDFLFEHGQVNCYDSEFNNDLLTETIGNYDLNLHNYRNDNHSDYNEFEKFGDIFNSEQDIHNKYLGIIKVLLEKKFDVNSILSNQKTPLTTALSVFFSKSITKLALYLIEECGADVNFVPQVNAKEKYTKDLEWCKKNGAEPPRFSLDDYMKTNNKTPLILACSIIPNSPDTYKEKYELCKLIINHNANVNYRHYTIIPQGSLDFFSTPLSAALLNIEYDAQFDKNCSIISLLFENGAKVTDSSIDMVTDIKNEELRKKICKILELTNEQLDAAHKRKVAR